MCVHSRAWTMYSHGKTTPGVAPESPPGSRSQKATGNKDKAGQQRTPREPTESHYSGVLHSAWDILAFFFPLIVVISLPEGITLAVLYQISHLLPKTSRASQDTFFYIFLSTRNKMRFTISLSPCLHWLSSTCQLQRTTPLPWC